MTRFLRLLVVAVTLLPGAARAEPVGVRSGDHDGFSRLLIQLRAPEDWVFGRVDGGFEFRPARDDITYQLDRVYDRIERNRIGDVRDLGDGRLFLEVSCDCHGVVDELADGQVVLDIVNGPGRAPGTGVNAALPPVAPVVADPAPMAPDTPMVAAVADTRPSEPVVVGDRAGLPLTFPRLPLGFALADRAPVPAGDGAAEAGPPEMPSHPSGDPALDRGVRIAQTETALLEQVARAAAQGLLDANMDELERSVADSSPAPAAPPPPPPVEPPAPPVTQRGHVTIETSVDRAAAAAAGTDGETDDGDSCVDPGFFDIAAWGSDIAGGTDIGAYRSGIVGEFDETDNAGVSALARNYIYITFGAEAKALLRRYPDSVERPDLLYAMAEIMDDGQATLAGDLVDQMACDGATALWATLAQPVLRPGQPLNRDAVALSFSALPAHLRRHLGPRLAEALLNLGEVETADRIRGAIDRTGNVETSEYGMLTAKFALKAGKVEQATATLDDVAAAGDATLPDALLERVDTTISDGGAVPQDIVVLLDSLAFQLRGTETAREMTEAGIRSRASTGAFSDGFAQLEAATTAGLFDPEQAGALRDMLFDRLVRDTDDTAFLRLSMSRIDEGASLPEPTRRALAGRLLDLGFASPAREILSRETVMPQPQDRQLLARAALLEGRPAAAIGYLAGIDDPAATALRARALALAKDHAGAMRAFEEAGDDREMLRAAWQGGLWPDVAMLDQGSIGAAAEMMEGRPALRAARATTPGGAVQTLGEPAGDTGVVPEAGLAPEAGGRDMTPLAAAQALIAESEAARRALEALLADLQAPGADLRQSGEPGL